MKLPKELNFKQDKFTPRRIIVTVLKDKDKKEKSQKTSREKQYIWDP